jgi:hypothetical protein
VEDLIVRTQDVSDLVVPLRLDRLLERHDVRLQISEPGKEDRSTSFPIRLLGKEVHRQDAHELRSLHSLAELT